MMITLKDHYQSKVDESNRARRAVSAAGAPPQLEMDLLGGLRRAVTNAQTRLALEYLFAIVDAQAAQIAELQGTHATPDPEPTMPGQPAPKPEPTKEAEPVEERKKTKKPADAPAEENV